MCHGGRRLRNEPVDAEVASRDLCSPVFLGTKRSECTSSLQSLVCVTGHQHATGLCTALSSTLSRQLTGPSPREKRKNGSAWVAHPCRSPDVLEPPTAWARAEQRPDNVIQSATSARLLHQDCGPCPSTQHARTEPHRPCRAHWDRSPWSFPRLFLPISPEQIADCPRFLRHD